MNERARIIHAYRRRVNANLRDRYSLFNAAELYLAQRRDEALLGLLRKRCIVDLAGCRILEIGCGRGARLLDWLRWQAAAFNLFGIDLMQDFVAEAARTLPQAQLVVASADQLPYADASFDIVQQFTVFTSILDSAMRQAAAGEMLRVLAPDGLILWYDFRYSNPGNPDVRGVGKREVRELFSGCDIEAVTLTLLPPLARLIAPISFAACRALEALLPPLRSHYLAIIRRA